jgi:hypothetical protein
VSRARVATLMCEPSKPETDDADRVVSRRVDRPTTASTQDEATYRAAGPVPDPEPDAVPRGRTAGDAAEEAADEVRDDEESEPTRSE